MGRRKRDKPEEVVDRGVGRVAEAAGSVTSDESLESEAVLSAGRRTERPTAWSPSRTEVG